ncbi:MAG TPA: hypothetical protein VIT02_06175 [Burkholderiaceae bacterium]
MNAITSILAPATLALFAFGAQAANISTGGETYGAQALPEAASQMPAPHMAAPHMAGMRAAGGGVSTGGETYSGVENRLTSFGSPAKDANLSEAGLEGLYLG